MFEKRDLAQARFTGTFHSTSCWVQAVVKVFSATEPGLQVIARTQACARC